MRARASAAGVDLFALSRADADLADPGRIEAALAAHPDIDLVLNAAAYTAVDRAESDEAAAFAVNALNWAADRVAVAAVGSLAVDRPTAFIWALLLVLGLV